MKIGVIGGGVVGRATARCWLEHCDEVRVYDIIEERCANCNGMPDILECDLVFVCVPESAVEELMSGFDSNYGRIRDTNLVLKSTVSIGTTRELWDKYKLPNLVHSPEFLTARCSITDAQVPARNIIGVTGGPMKVGLRTCGAIYYDLCQDRFPGVPIHLMTSDESEAVKLFCNAFFTTKVSFFNEINELSRKLGLDWNAIREGMLSDGRIGASHTNVPGPDGKLGFGGSCLPKDLETLRKCMLESGVLPEVIEGVQQRNELSHAKE